MTQPVIPQMGDLRVLEQLTRSLGTGSECPMLPTGHSPFLDLLSCQIPTGRAAIQTSTKEQVHALQGLTIQTYITP